jgi:hypothetical protein
MTACVNCDRALQPAWKYCIFCGTRTAVAATAPRSRPLPNPAAGTSVVTGGSRRASAPARTSVPAFSATAQTPIVPVAAPAPLAAAPKVPPVSSEWPETLGERPSLRSALAATEVPAPTPPAAPVPAPEDEVVELEAVPDLAEESQPAAIGPSISDLAHEPETDPEPETEPDPEAAVEPEPDPRRLRGLRRRPAKVEPVAEEIPVEETPVEEPEPEVIVSGPTKRPKRAAAASVAAEASVAEPVAETAPAAAPVKRKSSIKVFPDEEPLELDDDLEVSVTRVDRTGRVNILAVLALLLGVLASPLAALFGHVALGQLRASGERGVIPAWIAIVLGYLWLGFFLVLGITYLATNG